jgi:hypothetical protein
MNFPKDMLLLIAVLIAIIVLGLSIVRLVNWHL